MISFVRRLSFHVTVLERVGNYDDFCDVALGVTALHLGIYA